MKILEEIITSHNVKALAWNWCYEPYALARDKKIQESLKGRVTCHAFNSSYLTEPGELKSKTGTAYQIFKPYWNSLKALGQFPAPVPVPQILPYKEPVSSDSLEMWKLHPTKPDWSAGLAEEWKPGEEGARQRLSAFLTRRAETYETDRDFPGLEGTSKLSPHLHWGEISPRQVWHATCAAKKTVSADRWAFLRELAWREFSVYLLFHFPELPQQPLRSQFSQFPWTADKASLHKWQKGQTGYPIVDAGMRQLWRTGWMHNRVRMIVASFLVKDLLVAWQDGAAWFLDTLVDADLANNSASWQWVAGSGTDAAPYFRILNPVLQAEKFDPKGDYVRRWVPELAALPTEHLHSPWKAPPAVLKAAGVTLGQSYPRPLVDHAEARVAALKAFERVKGAPNKKAKAEEKVAPEEEEEEEAEPAEKAPRKAKKAANAAEKGAQEKAPRKAKKTEEKAKLEEDAEAEAAERAPKKAKKAAPEKVAEKAKADKAPKGAKTAAAEKAEVTEAKLKATPSKRTKR